MNPPTIRFAKPSDIEPLVELCAEHSLHEQVEYSATGKRQKLHQLLFGNDPNLTCLVVEADSNLIGYATFTVQISTWLGANYLYLDCLFLRQGFRGMGLGKSLMLRVQQEAMQRDCREIQWQTPLFNDDAIKFYNRLANADCLQKARYRWPTNSQTAYQSRNDERSNMSSVVSRIPAADSHEAQEHFAKRLTFETDCWDINHAITNDRKDFVLLDVRSEVYFRAGHLPTAINLPHWKINEQTLAQFPADTLFVVYCAGPHCNGANKGALALAKLGRPVKEMIGGSLGWVDEGFALVVGEVVSR